MPQTQSKSILLENFIVFNRADDFARGTKADAVGAWQTKLVKAYCNHGEGNSIYPPWYFGTKGSVQVVHSLNKNQYLLGVWSVVLTV